MLRAYFVLIGGLLSGGFLLLVVMASGAQAGMNRRPFELHRSEKPRAPPPPARG